MTFGITHACSILYTVVGNVQLQTFQFQCRNSFLKYVTSNLLVFFQMTFAKSPTCQSSMWWLNYCQMNKKCIFLNFYEWKFSYFDVQMHAFTNQTTHEHLKYPDHSPMNLFVSLLTITYRHIPNCQIGKAFRKKKL